VKVVASDEVRHYVEEHGGTLYVRSARHGCCGGGVTLLESSTQQPRDADDFLPVAADDIDVRFRCDHGQPHELVIELRGRLRRRPAAYWDGCAFRP
jgi:hypothetical protein